MPPTISDNRWVREPDDFAVELRERDLSGLFSRRIRIEEGTTGLLMVQGRFDKRLDPGEHVLQGGILGGQGRKRIVLVNLGEVMLYITLPRLLTRDPVPFGVQTAITLRYTPGREAVFLSNFMSGREYLGSNELRQLVYTELNEAAQIWAGQHTIKELAEDLTLRDDLAIALESHVRPILDRYGLTFGRTEVREFKCDIWDRTLNMRVETSLQISEEQANLEGRKRFFDIAVEKDIQEMAEETQKVATYEKRIQLWQRMQQAANQEEMNKINSEQDLVDFIRQTDRDGLLKDNEFERFKVAQRESGDDHDRLRVQFLRIAEMEEEYDFRRRELSQQSALSREQLEGELGLERLGIEGRLETELKRTDLTLERQRRETEYRRSQDDMDGAARWERELREARTSADVQGIARETARLDAELALALEDQKNAQDRANEQEQSRMELDRRAAEQELAIKSQEEDLDRRLKELQERHKQELESMQAMDSLSLHALIAVADGEKAPLLAELARTEAFKSMTPEQIMAMASEKNPELGNAIAEIATRGDNEQAKVMYERLLDEQKASAGEMRESQRETTQTMQEMFNKALETQASVAQAFAQGGGQAAQSQPPPVAPPTAEPHRVVLCRRCFQESAVGTKFCPNCGDTLMAQPG